MLRRVFTSSYMAGVAVAALAHGGMLAGVFLLAPASASGLGARDDVFVVTLVEEPAPESVPEPEADAAPEPEKQNPVPVPEVSEAPPAPAIEAVAEQAPPVGAAPSEDMLPVEVPAVDAGSEQSASAAEGPAVLTIDSDIPAVASEPEPVKAEASAGAASLNGDGKAMLDAYLRDVRLQLSRHAPRGVRGAGNCEVEFRLSRAGEVIFVGIRTSSGSRLYDRRCLSSVTSAVPFPVAPDGALETDLSFTIVVQQKR